MVQCELCGVDTGSPTTVTVEEAELEVCDECADFGTAVETESTESTAKYDTGSDGSADDGSSSGGTAASGASTTTGPSTTSTAPSGGDAFADLDAVAPDYGDRIQEAREVNGWSQADLADRLNEKASRIRKLEREEMLPSDDVQRALERELDIDLSAGGAGGGDGDWRAEAATDGTTLGDIVERKDS